VIQPHKVSVQLSGHRGTSPADDDQEESDEPEEEKSGVAQPGPPTGASLSTTTAVSTYNVTDTVTIDLTVPDSLSGEDGSSLSQLPRGTIADAMRLEIYEKLRPRLRKGAEEHSITRRPIFGDLAGYCVANNGSTVLWHGEAVGEVEGVLLILCR